MTTISHREKMRAKYRQSKLLELAALSAEIEDLQKKPHRSSADYTRANKIMMEALHCVVAMVGSDKVALSTMKIVGAFDKMTR